MSIGRAAQVLGARHEYLVKAIRKNELHGVPHEAYDGTIRYLVTSGELRRFRDWLVAKYSASPTESRRVLAESLRRKRI